MEHPHYCWCRECNLSRDFPIKVGPSPRLKLVGHPLHNIQVKLNDTFPVDVVALDVERAEAFRARRAHAPRTPLLKK